MYDYQNEKASFDQTKFAFDYYRESYFLTFSKKQADELMSHGYQLEYTNNECYVIRLQKLYLFSFYFYFKILKYKAKIWQNIQCEI